MGKVSKEKEDNVLYIIHALSNLFFIHKSKNNEIQGWLLLYHYKEKSEGIYNAVSPLLSDAIYDRKE